MSTAYGESHPSQPIPPLEIVPENNPPKLTLLSLNTDKQVLGRYTLTQPEIDQHQKHLEKATDTASAAHAILEFVSNLTDIEINTNLGLEIYQRDYQTERDGRAGLDTDALEELFETTNGYDDSILVLTIKDLDRRTHKIPALYYKTAERIVRILIAKETEE